jgi:hypothetical protein
MSVLQGVSDSATGLPSASTTAGTFVGRRGNGRWLDFRRLFLGAGAVLMRTNDGRVDHHCFT